MLENGKNGYIFKKSYEISYALWRIAANMQEVNFADKLYGKAIELVGLAADEDFESIVPELNSLELLLKFAGDVDLLQSSNADILQREIGNLKSAIFDYNAAIHDSGKKDNQVDISDIFSESHDGGGSEVEFAEIETEIFAEDGDSIIKEDANDFPAKPQSFHEQTGGVKAAIRQSAILEKIRQFGNCRLGDILAILPDSSERTIRYDLEALVQQNLIERVGVGGRGVYYKARV